VFATAGKITDIPKVGTMFNSHFHTDLPGFRLSMTEDEPGFRIDTNDSIRHSVVSAPSHVFYPGGANADPSAGLNAYASVSPADFVNSRSNSTAYRMLGASPYMQKADNCPQIIENCRLRCTGRYLDGMLPGRGSDAPMVLRRCIRDCVGPSGCSY
jgi:hypothetical protein